MNPGPLTLRRLTLVHECCAQRSCGRRNSSGAHRQKQEKACNESTEAGIDCAADEKEANGLHSLPSCDDVPLVLPAGKEREENEASQSFHHQARKDFPGRLQLSGCEEQNQHRVQQNVHDAGASDSKWPRALRGRRP